MSLNVRLFVVLNCGEEIEVNLRQTPTSLTEDMLERSLLEAAELYIAWLRKIWPDNKDTESEADRILNIVNDQTIECYWDYL